MLSGFELYPRWVPLTGYYSGLEAKVRTDFSLKQTNLVKEIAHFSFQPLKTPTKQSNYFYLMNLVFLRYRNKLKEVFLKTN